MTGNYKASKLVEKSDKYLINSVVGDKGLEPSTPTMSR